jgi:hypothetical protein
LKWSDALLSVLFLISPPGWTAAQTRNYGFSVRWERSVERFHYRFQNPSAFETSELVPHDYTQSYWANNHWLTLENRYRIRRFLLETEVAGTPERTTRGDDFDRFFQPNGDVVVSGTTGNVSLRSFRIKQYVFVGASGGFDWHLGYQYRRDRSIFHAGTVLVTHTKPSLLFTDVTNERETAVSENHELRISMSRQWASSHRLRPRAVVEISPLLAARLNTKLPDKYPGRDFVDAAPGFLLEPGVSIEYDTRLPVSLSFRYSRAFSYRSSREFGRSALVFGFSLRAR